MSPLETAIRAGAGEFRRQLCWRDFYAQLLWANPHTQTADLYPRRHDWDDDREALAAWQEGRTGYPIVDHADAVRRFRSRPARLASGPPVRPGAIAGTGGARATLVPCSP